MDIPSRDKLIAELKEASRPTILLIAKLINLYIDSLHVESENTTGDEDLIIKGQIKAHRKLLGLLKLS